MKTSSKITTLLVALTALTFSAKAQTSQSSEAAAAGIRYSVGVESGIATGNFRRAHSWNLGGSVQADIPVASQLYVTANAGYNNLFGKDHINGTGASAADLHLIPVKVGVKFFPIAYLYVQGEAGAAFTLNKAATGPDKSAAFIYAPQIGILLPLGSRNAIDAGVKYESSTNFDSNSANSKVSFLGIRVAYAFGL